MRGGRRQKSNECRKKRRGGKEELKGRGGE